jgi:CheY-like chemotaxis protein
MTIDYLRPLNILVVDDVDVHRFLMVKGLQRLNPCITINEATSVSQAVEKLESGTFNVVISDWSMPGGGGNELVKWMRQRVHFERVPFIMISSNSDQEDIIQAFMRLGIDAYVTKPFKPNDLYQKVIAALDSRQGD